MAILRARLLPWLLALAAMLLVGVFSYVTARRYFAMQTAVRETLSAQESMAETLSLLKDAETGGRGFLLTDDPRYLAPYEDALPALEKHLATLRALSDEQPSLRDAALRVDALAHKRVAIIGEMVALRRAGGLSGREAIPYLERGRSTMEALRTEIAALLARGDQRLHERERAMAAASQRLELVLAVALLGGVALALGGFAEARRDAKEAQVLNELLRAQSVRDELTGLYNRRGFMELSGELLSVAQRMQTSAAVFFVDLNGMKQVNDELGHEAGDHAIRAAADLLGRVFRSTDVISRLGGDEFAVFSASVDSAGIAAIRATLKKAVDDVNAASTARYRLSISTGAAIFDAAAPVGLSALMQAADANMYEEKRERRQRFSMRVLTS